MWYKQEPFYDSIQKQIDIKPLIALEGLIAYHEFKWKRSVPTLSSCIGCCKNNIIEFII